MNIFRTVIGFLECLKKNNVVFLCLHKIYYFGDTIPQLVRLWDLDTTSLLYNSKYLTHSCITNFRLLLNMKWRDKVVDACKLGNIDRGESVIMVRDFNFN